MTSHVPLGDSQRGGALFLLPREIRDEIYRLLVKGSYLDTKCFYRWSGKDSRRRTRVRPKFAILQLSKSIGREATEILYSESIFRFVITTDFGVGKLLSPDFDRMKRLAPMIQNVVLDVRQYDVPDTWYETNMGMVVQSFGGLAIPRRSLLVRMLGCSQCWLGCNRLPRVCQQLKAFVGFRATTLEMWPVERLLSGPPKCSNPVREKRDRETRSIVARIAQALAEELEPVLGPAISGSKCDGGNVPLRCLDLSNLRDPSLIGYLKFHSNKHLVQNQAVKEDQV